MCLIWSVSASVPIGLYSIDSPPGIRGGDLVAVMPDRSLADFIVERGYIGRDLLLMKYVAALPGQRFAARATL
ncbi:hypothetical protein GOC56_27560 [Sinorhizobium meliloti]|nr:hypothetical protein [Sinorhizobium meliloti]MDW9514632.1 hypothetical protein [Sinorhizobium meliloti]MDX0377587.1 hypothetical protein [Sinorhizobium meliloti]